MCASDSVAYVRFKSFNTVRNHVKLEICSFVMNFNSAVHSDAFWQFLVHWGLDKPLLKIQGGHIK